MGLSCACDDFDKGDCDRWWEHGRPSIPEAGTRCCECNAPLPNENCDTILKGAVYEPDVERPPYPEDVMGKEPADSVLSRHWDQRYDALQAVLDDFDDEYGWDSECERFERFTTEYRCERCADLAFAFEGDEDDGGMGYCMIAPGELPEAHCDYMLESGAPEDLNDSMGRRGKPTKPSLQTNPSTMGYKGDDVPREFMAEAIRAYMQDPNYIKSVAPKTAARIREHVNGNPRFSDLVQFNANGRNAILPGAVMQDTLRQPQGIRDE